MEKKETIPLDERLYTKSEIIELMKGLKIPANPSLSISYILKELLKIL